MKSGERATKQSRSVGGSEGEDAHSEGTEIGSVKLSPKSRLHEKCVASYEFESEIKKKKKKPGKKYPEEVVRFVEGTPNLDEEVLNSTRKNPGSARKKSPRYNTEIRFLEHKYIQCNIVKTNEEADMTLPEEIKPLLINVTFLLHELKQKPESKSQEDLCSVISKVASLLAELSRRPIKRTDHAPTPFDEIAGKLISILKEHSGPENEQYETLLKEIKHLEQEVIRKESEVNYVKEQIQEERARFMPESTCLDDCLWNSIRKNQSLKAEIKYNKAQFRKYDKILAQKEQLRQKSLLELNTLRRKYARLEQSMDTSKPAYIRLYHADSDVHHGGSLTKYIKSKVQKEKKVRCSVGKMKSTVPGHVRKPK